MDPVFAGSVVSAVAGVVAALIANRSRKHARGANKAVNAVEPGEPTLRERFSRLELQHQALTGDVDKIGENLAEVRAKTEHMAGQLDVVVARIIRN